MQSKEKSSSLHLHKMDNIVALMFCTDDHQLSTMERNIKWKQKAEEKSKK